jgi:RhoGAP domain
MAFFARRRAILQSVVCMQSDASYPYHRLEKVKFGVPLDEVCKNVPHCLPGPLLVLILRLNKEAPMRKDIFRAPGNQGAMKKLIHFLQQGRLVNVDNYSVYTIASVLKKFLRKIPGDYHTEKGVGQLPNIVNRKMTLTPQHPLLPFSQVVFSGVKTRRNCSTSSKSKTKQSNRREYTSKLCIMIHT